MYFFFLAIWTSSFEKATFSSFAHLFIGSFILGEFSFWVPCIFWSSVSCQMYSWQRFSPILWEKLFNLETISFVVQKPVFLVSKIEWIYTCFLLSVNIWNASNFGLGPLEKPTEHQQASLRWLEILTVEFLLTMKNMAIGHFNFSLEKQILTNKTSTH
jgi:hypothetical protein